MGIMMTSSNGNILSVSGHLCGEFTVTGKFPTQRPVTRSFDVFFDLRVNKRLSKQSWGWWRFETPSRPLWRQSNDSSESYKVKYDDLYRKFCLSYSPKRLIIPVYKYPYIFGIYWISLNLQQHFNNNDANSPNDDLKCWNNFYTLVHPQY